MRKPWNKIENARFGLKLFRTKGRNEAGLGWAVIGRKPNVLIESQETAPDTVERMVEVYRREAANRPDCDGITLYRYATARTFRSHRPPSDPMTHAQHNALIERAAVRLAEEDIPFKIEIVDDRPKDMR